MNRIIKPLTEKHFQQSMELSSFAFQFPLTEDQLESRRDTFISNDQLKLGVFNDEQLCAQATLLHLNTYIGGKAFSMGGIAGVSTWPEHRRHGYVAALLSELLERMRKNGQSISMLYPFSFSFYRKFGWESCVDHKTIELGTEQLQSIIKNMRYKKQQGKIVRLKDWKQLQQVYNQYAIRYNGMLQRTAYWWETSVAKRKKGIYAAYEDNQGILQGYIIYEAINRQMTIHEFVSLTYEAEQALLFYISQHDSMVEKVRWVVQKDDEIVFSLDNPRVKQDIMPYFMARIVDLQVFVEQYPFLTAHHEEEYTIAITDQQAAWNDGTFILTIHADGKAKIHRSPHIVKADISITIGALTAWLLNYQNWDTMVRFEKVTGSIDHLKRLQRRIPTHSTYLTDFF